MTEKRYNKSILRVIKTGVIDENNNELNTDEVVDLLNELTDENEDLKRINQKLKKNMKKFYTKEEWELKEVLGDFR